MARATHRLNDPLIRALKPEDKDRFVADGNGLWLRVRATGSKSWIVRRKVGGKQVVVTLGQYPAISLRDAREAALQHSARHTHAVAATMSVREAMQEYLGQLRWKRLAGAQTYANAIVDAMGGKRVRDIGSRDVLKMIERYRVGRPVAANRLLAFAKGFFGWCEDHEFCPVSPAARLQRKRHGSKEEPRDRVLTDEELRALWRLDHPHAPLLRFLALVPCRIAEAQGMAWSEISGTRWTIPASRTKSGREHWYELPPAAQALLGERLGGRVFKHQTSATAVQALISPQGEITGRVFRHQTSATAVQAFLRRWQKERVDAWTPHDLRRTARTRATGQLGVREVVAEKWLGHRLEGILQTYDTGEYEPERVKLAHDWAAVVEKIVG